MDNRKKMLLAVAGILLIMIVWVVASGCFKDTFFEDLVSETLDVYPYTVGLGHATDGSYLKYNITPNTPHFEMFGDFAWEQELGALGYINQRLGFSPALYEKMIETTEAMGVQTDSNKKFEVTWSYSSDNGLYIIYERN